MPTDDVSDLRDVVDAINKLCETMKTSYDEYEDCEDHDESITSINPCEQLEEAATLPQSTLKSKVLNDSNPESVIHMNSCDQAEVIENWNDTVIQYTPSVPESTTVINSIETNPPIVNDIEVFARCNAEKIDRLVEDVEFVASDLEPIAESVPCEPMSEMYYTASSEVSLVSDIDLQDKAQSEDSDKEKDDRNSVMAGHVAAMRERFESMTRTNTPCPDLIRSTSPSFEVFRNFNTSPDNLG